ncbi:MAG: glycosyltransferase family 2 protein [Proteobacteria bacterium]|nr:glycosyltransferase family 2 protein [Pseudomonadota bacterium]MBU1686091.1 glycosyltransferase family 2 protein [Pseudomonadota bacterium]
MKKIDLSLIIPLFNEEASLPSLTNQLEQVLAPLSLSYEIILIDDGSLDRTYEVVTSLAARNPRIRGLRFSRNFGKEAAMLAGLEHAMGSGVVIMDGDGQHPPELLPELLAPWQQGKADIVVACKANRSTDSLFSQLAAWLFNRLMHSLTGIDLTGGSDYRLLDRRVVDAVITMQERIRFFRGMSTWVGFREVRVPFTVKERLAGKSNWSTRQLAGLAISAITAYTAKPLSWVLGLGGIGLFLSLILLIQALVSRFFGTAVSGWTSLTVLVLFFGSANLMAAGLVGIYLARVFDEVKNRPVYIVQEETGTDKTEGMIQ